MGEHAEICPVCSGSGKYKNMKCHGCDGRGWVKVGTDYPHISPYRPYQPEPYQPSPWYRRGYDVICQIP